MMAVDTPVSCTRHPYPLTVVQRAQISPSMVGCNRRYSFNKAIHLCKMFIVRPIIIFLMGCEEH